MRKRQWRVWASSATLKHNIITYTPSHAHKQKHNANTYPLGKTKKCCLDQQYVADRILHTSLHSPETGHYYVLVKTNCFKNSPPLACSVSAHKSPKKIRWSGQPTGTACKALHLTHSLQLMQLTTLTDPSLCQHVTHSSLTES